MKTIYEKDKQIINKTMKELNIPVIVEDIDLKGKMTIKLTNVEDKYYIWTTKDITEFAKNPKNLYGCTRCYKTMDMFLMWEWCVAIPDSESEGFLLCPECREDYTQLRMSEKCHDYDGGEEDECRLCENYARLTLHGADYCYECAHEEVEDEEYIRLIDILKK
jgi:hypothetical protein